MKTEGLAQQKCNRIEKLWTTFVNQRRRLSSLRTIAKRKKARLEAMKEIASEQEADYHKIEENVGGVRLEFEIDSQLGDRGGEVAQPELLESKRNAILEEERELLGIPQHVQLAAMEEISWNDNISEEDSNLLEAGEGRTDQTESIAAVNICDEEKKPDDKDDGKMDRASEAMGVTPGNTCSGEKETSSRGRPCTNAEYEHSPELIRNSKTIPDGCRDFQEQAQSWVGVCPHCGIASNYEVFSTGEAGEDSDIVSEESQVTEDVEEVLASVEGPFSILPVEGSALEHQSFEHISMDLHNRSINIVGKPFEQVAIDLIGPLERSLSGRKFILVVFDYCTMFPEAFPLSSTDSVVVAELLMQVFSRHGKPAAIHTDVSPDFLIALWTELGRFFSGKDIGIVQCSFTKNREIQQLNSALLSMVHSEIEKFPRSQRGQSNWDKRLPAFLLRYRNTERENSGFSPYQLLYGRRILHTHFSSFGDSESSSDEEEEF